MEPCGNELGDPGRGQHSTDNDANRHMFGVEHHASYASSVGAGLPETGIGASQS